MNGFPNVIKLLEEKIVEEEGYVKVGEQDRMPNMKKYYQKRVAEYRKAVKVLSAT